jgi:hypothetical protein
MNCPWRRDISSLNYLLASHVWQQDHNGFTHQDPGFLDHVINKKADIVRCYLPADANCLLSVFDHCLRSRNYVNVVVAGKHALPQWLTMDQAVVHCTEGLGIWQWASNDQGSEPDVVMACCGDTPTLEILAAVSILREHLPELKMRVINVVDLMKLQPATEHPHGLTELEYDSLFTQDKHIVFGFHGYPWLIHRLDLPAHEPQAACPRLQGRGHDHDPVRHARAERPGPFPPGAGRCRSRSEPGLQRSVPEAEHAGQTHPAQALHQRSRPGYAGNSQLEMERRQMNIQTLASTANEMVANGKGLLAIDESTGTCNKRFAQWGIPQSAETRRQYRQLIVNAPGLGRVDQWRHSLRRNHSPAER